MKAIALVTSILAAAAAVAQQPRQSASDELAAVIVVEEQERDLAKAERLYREALGGKALSAAARELATTRLAGVLARLGRADEAKRLLGAVDTGAVVTIDDIPPSPQDRERAAALRAKAGDLVKQYVEKGQPAGDQLRWLGEAAVPEIIAYLQTALGAGGYQPATVSSLFRLLWEIGGPQAAAFLREAKDHEHFAGFAATTAAAARSREMVDVVEQYLRGKADVSLAALASGVRRHFPMDRLIEILARGTVEQRAWLLANGADAKTPQLLALVREALASTDPQLGTLAQKLLSTTNWQYDLRVIDLQLEAGVDTMQFVPQWLLTKAPDPERARRWFDLAMAAARRMGPFTGDARQVHVVMVLGAVRDLLDVSVVPQLLSLLDQGYPGAHLLRGKVTAANAGDVFARFGALAPDQRSALVEALAAVDLPGDLLPKLIAVVDQGLIDSRGVAPLVARTGHEDAAAWLLAGWRATQGNEAEQWAWELLELGRRNQGEPVRAAMRTVAAVSKDRMKSALYLALLSMHDSAALAQMTTDIASHEHVEHPYATRAKHPITPLAYVLHDQPDPPHGFTTEERIAFVGTIGQWEGNLGGSRALIAPRVADRIVMALAEHCDRPWFDQENPANELRWTRVAAFRIAREEALDGPLHRWLDQQLQKPGRAMGVVEHLAEREVRHVRPRLDALVAGDDPAIAETAYSALERCGLALDFETLMQSKHPGVAERAFQEAMNRGELSIPSALHALTVWPNSRDTIASYLGAKVAIDGVPALLRLLQDPEKHVRERAAEALARIRFHHEQQAHWDRVTKGLDASPASAAEKLLLQAKPGAPKEQRLLAIVSLGTLGKPEALPFLIDWTQDADAEIAQKAKDAIARIHLEPRR